MHPDVEELQPKLKEFLYDCAVEIKATKAALYLFDEGSGRFELTTEYGFRGGIRRVADQNDPVIDRCGRGRTPFFVNGVAAEPRFAELLFESATDRLLAAPLYQRGQLVGAIDMRDKAGRQPFDNNDIPKAQRIAERIAGLFAGRNIFGHRFITLSEADDDAAVTTMSGAAVSSAAPKPAAQPSAPAAAPPIAKQGPPARPQPRPTPMPSAPGPRLAPLIIEARNAVSRLMVSVPPEVLSEADVAAGRDVLRSVLLIPGAVVAMFSAFGVGVQEIAARTTLTEEAKALLHSKLNVWLAKRGDAAGAARVNVATPFGTSAAPIVPNDLQKVFTAPLAVGSIRGLYLTVAFANTPDRVAHELLAVLHSHLQLTIEQSMQRTSLSSSRLRIAEKLIEPDFAKFPHLRAHVTRVARLADSFARFIALPQHDLDVVRVVALVHDAGMRVLDYERLYRKRNLSEEELSILREHASVGAALIEPHLGSEIAKAVLHHHERFDGRGYPAGISGEEIPFASRLVAICDAYLAITDPDTYQPPETHDEALAAITRGANAQFDPELAARFVEMMRALSTRGR